MASFLRTRIVSFPLFAVKGTEPFKMEVQQTYVELANLSIWHVWAWGRIWVLFFFLADPRRCGKQIQGAIG
jgi:hypothetical protein